MFFHTATICFASYFLLLLQQSSPVELVPVEEAVEDRNVLSTSFKTSTLDLLHDQSFERLYKVVGTDDVYVRRAGGLRAVFRNPTYIETNQGSIAKVPAGTVYCIGEVTPQVLRQLGVLVNSTRSDEEQTREVMPKTHRIPPMQYMRTTRTIRFLDDEQYRRKRLAWFVLEVAMTSDQ